MKTDSEERQRQMQQFSGKRAAELLKVLMARQDFNPFHMAHNCQVAIDHAQHLIRTLNPEEPK